MMEKYIDFLTGFVLPLTFQCVCVCVILRYFSRAVIPHNKRGRWDAKCLYWRKLGIYSYRADFLHT